jgi:hypothetical protein
VSASAWELEKVLLYPEHPMKLSGKEDRVIKRNTSGVMEHSPTLQGKEKLPRKEKHTECILHRSPVKGRPRSFTPFTYSVSFIIAHTQKEKLPRRPRSFTPFTCSVSSDLHDQCILHHFLCSPLLLQISGRDFC